MSSERDINDAELWKRLILIAVLFLTAVVISGTLLIMLSDFF